MTGHDDRGDRLARMVTETAREIEDAVRASETGDADAWEDGRDPVEALLEDACDIYVETRLGNPEAIHATRVVMCAGGPLIEVRVEQGIVRGAWGTDERIAPLSDGAGEALGDRIRECWRCQR